jgi:hypothetical protein
MSESELKLVGFAIDKEHGIIIRKSLLINRPLTTITIFFRTLAYDSFERGPAEGPKVFFSRLGQ